MEDMCADDDCTDDAEWVLKVKDPTTGKIAEEQYCNDHMKKYAAKAKADGKVVIGLDAYEGDEEDDDDEDEDAEDDSEEGAED